MWRSDLESSLNPFYVNPMGTVHYKIANAGDAPFLYTKFLTSCIGIGLIYRPDNQVEKLSIYHSVSEHSIGKMTLENNRDIDIFDKTEHASEYFTKCISGNDEAFLDRNRNNGSYFIKATAEFLKSIDDVENVYAVIHTNKKHLPWDGELSEAPDFKRVNLALNLICSFLDKNNILFENYYYTQGSGEFLLSRAGHIDLQMEDPEELAFITGQFIYELFPEGNLNPLDEFIINQLEHASNNPVSWVELCFTIQNEIEAQAPNVKNTEKLTLYKRILSATEGLEQLGLFDKLKYGPALDDSSPKI